MPVYKYFANTQTKQRQKDILCKAVDREWKVRKQAFKLCRVGPVGILYIGYLHNIHSNK